MGIFAIISFYSFAQDKNWSIEANYPISIGDKLGNDNPGILDLGIKYRFLNLTVAKIGLGFNAGVFNDRVRSYDNPTGGVETVNFIENNWLFQPKVFLEFQIPGITKLRPSIGLGYTFITSSFNGDFGSETLDSSSSNSGLNLNLGLSYDLTKRLFIQAQFDYVRFNIRNDSSVYRNDNLGFLKFGLGFRF